MNFKEVFHHFFVHSLAASCIWPILLLIQAWGLGFGFAIIMGISFLYWTALRLEAFESLDPDSRVSYLRVFVYSATIMVLVYITGSIILEIICLSQLVANSPCYNGNVDLGFPIIFTGLSLVASAFFMIPLAAGRSS